MIIRNLWLTTRCLLLHTIKITAFQYHIQNILHVRVHNYMTLVLIEIYMHLFFKNRTIESDE